MSIITVDDAKAHLNITTPDDDMLIQAKIDAASNWIDLYTGSAFELPQPYALADGSTIMTPDAPASVKEACRLLTAHLYQNREASLVGMTAQSLPFGLLDMLMPFKAFAF